MAQPILFPEKSRWISQFSLSFAITITLANHRRIRYNLNDTLYADFPESLFRRSIYL